MMKILIILREQSEKWPKSNSFDKCNMNLEKLAKIRKAKIWAYSHSVFNLLLKRRKKEEEN